jgi:hypothetical protein
MAITVKGRATIRSKPPGNRAVRRIEPWVLEAKPNTTLAKLEDSYMSALDSVDALEAHKMKAQQSGTLTPTGIATDALNYAASELAPRLKKAKLSVEQARREAEARRSKLTLKKSDPADVAGQLRRLYRLDKLNAMSDAARNNYIAEHRDNLDPELAQAILELPEHAKLLPSDIEAIHEHVLKEQHGEQEFTELSNLESAIKVAGDTIAAAYEEISFDVGGAAKLREAAAPYEKMVGSAWLKKFNTGEGEEVRAFNIRNGHGYWDPADADQIENGNFYASAQEWRMANEGVVPPSMTKTNGAGT